MYTILDKINKPADLQGLNEQEIKTLCSEIRNFLVEKVTKNGGHLASNLGVVELTVALMLVYNVEEDKIIWDVGHQSYVYKILTNRREQFDTLRQYEGISGFPKTKESKYDCFNTGHSSTSASAAVGMARARDLTKKNYEVAAVFGDGALTGGMIYEALNDVGHNKTPLVFVLNDNEMSISQNVGGVSKYLGKLRYSPSYYRSKNSVKRILDKTPFIGQRAKNSIIKFKNAIKKSVLASTLFEDMGIEYLGPVDGHNVSELKKMLLIAKSMEEPVILHVVTKKGKGYGPAEENPQSYHGISPSLNKQENNKKFKDYSHCAGSTMEKIFKNNEKVVAITAAMPDGVGFSGLFKDFSGRLFDVGIAEQHAVTMAAGLAISGIIPVFGVYSSFLQRSYDQILHDVCLQNLHVVFLVDRAGVVGADGETHHGLYDMAYLSQMPNMTVLSPCSFAQLEEMIDYAVNCVSGPVAIRYPRGNVSYDAAEHFTPQKPLVIGEIGENVIITTGTIAENAIEAVEILKKDNIKASVLVLNEIKNDCDEVYELIKNAKHILTIEDHNIYGGISSIIGTMLSKKPEKIKFSSLAFPCEPITQGSVCELYRHYGLDAVSCADKMKELLNG